MANKYYYFKGKTKWMRPDKPDQYGKWKHVLYPDPESLNLFRQLQESTPTIQGIKNVLKKDDDGYFFSISRDQQKMINGKVVGYAPPEILDGSKKLPDGSFVPLRNVNIGNGSDVVTKVEYYDYPIPGNRSRGSAIRWQSSRIDNLIPFQGRQEFTVPEEQLTRNIETPTPSEGW